MSETSKTTPLGDSFQMVGDPETISIQQMNDEIEKMEKKTTHMKFHDDVVRIGQTLRMIALSAKNKDERSISSSIKLLRKLLLPYEQNLAPCTPPKPLWQTMFGQKDSDDYVKYFCGLIASLYKNIVETGGKKGALNPLGREEGEAPMLVPNITLPFIIAARRATKELDSNDINELVEMSKDMVRLEKRDKEIQDDPLNLAARLEKLKSRGGKAKTHKKRRQIKGKKAKTRKEKTSGGKKTRRNQKYKKKKTQRRIGNKK